MLEIPVSFSTDAWKTDDLIFVWKEGDPVQIDDGLHLPRFTLERFQTAYCNSKTNTGNASSKQPTIAVN